jgi:ABC-2 type transport system permease protein
VSAVEGVVGRAGDLADAEPEGRLGAVTAELMRRGWYYTTRVPATVIPVLIMPIFFTLAFSGAFSAVANIPGFPTDNILDWMVPYAVLQGAAFAGLGASFNAGRDLETGFYDRLLVAPVNRLGLVAGPLLFSAVRGLFPIVIVMPIALLGGASLPSGVLGLLPLILAAMGVAILSGLWGLGVAYRTRSQRSGALTQVGLFVVMFLSIGTVPLAVMEGWLHGAARLNPYTNVLRMARQGFIGDVTWGHTWPGLAALTVFGLLLGLFAWRGFRKLIP